ncbi:hypothetical protein BC351_00755 [Paenibacillus ferrarius]|uniref:Core-binding (CB) domain-containing protein n=1 Tax=Paenibacillus ferrarius TaxID=1469647 RepID=A0A1V4HTH1_9BACL|nr:tyrosine-type recombinase/integrase [Paenibacillus ferrarius]OPH61803.1 hypothetical protein BC351_00755 [Paenibacillus ferrarius]
MTKNKIYDLRYYNEYQKMRFLKTVSENTTYHQLCSRLLGRVSRLEEMYDKDLYDFSLPELERFFRYLNASKISTSRMNIQAINTYIEWANVQNLRKTNINPLTIIMDDDYFRSFIDESKQTIFSEEEIDDIVRECKNAQDAVIIQLMFEGASGTGLDELLNLQRKNIDFNHNRLLLTDSDESTRILEVSEKCMKLIQEALDQTVYQKNNGVFESDRGSAEISLVENDYVVKSTKLGKLKSFEKADKFLVHRRLAVLGDPDMLDKPYLSPKNIKYSGMLKIAKDYYLRDGSIEKQCGDEIGSKFNIRKLNGEYVIMPYKRDFINIDTIRKVYNIE